jgi:hypothetical protein
MRRKIETWHFPVKTVDWKFVMDFEGINSYVHTYDLRLKLRMKTRNSKTVNQSTITIGIMRGKERGVKKMLKTCITFLSLLTLDKLPIKET